MKVIVKQQSANGSATAEMVWTGSAAPADDLSVMLSVAQLLQHAKDEAPWTPRILEIRIEL